MREITRVAVPETEEFWIESAAKYNCKQIQMMVANTPKGSLPNGPRSPSEHGRAVKTRIYLDMEPEQATVLMEAVAQVTTLAGESVSLADAVEPIAQDFLNTAHRDEDLGKRFRLIIHCDPAGKLGWVNTPRGVLRVSHKTVEQALCDAEILDLRKVDEQPRPDRALATPSTGDAADGLAAAGTDVSRPTRDVPENGATPSGISSMPSPKASPLVKKPPAWPIPSRWPSRGMS